MSNINETNIVKQQYKSSGNLNTRISIHEKYSTNKLGFGNWIFANYVIENGMKVLELGCGTGDMWINKKREIDKCDRLILSDFSEGMLETAKKNLSSYKDIEYQVIDIQNIPFEDETFDIVIANMMLYHVPDMELGISEVKRVLKDDGAFYCATFGEHGIMEYLSNLLSEYGITDSTNKNFTLQNGNSILRKAFTDVRRENYEDSLVVTNISDIVDYIYSLSGMTSLSSIPREKVEQILLKHTKDGALNIPKEYGMFICHK